MSSKYLRYKRGDLLHLVKGCAMCYPVYGMGHIKEHLLLIGNSSPGGGSGFPRLRYAYAQFIHAVEFSMLFGAYADMLTLFPDSSYFRYKFL